MDINFEKSIDYTQQIKNLVDWKNPPTVKDLKNDLIEAKSNHSLHVQNVDNWLSDLKGNLKVKPKEGRSKIQPKLIRKQAEWVYASLESPYLSSQDIFDVNPVSHLDEEAAIQNGLVLNKQFRVDIPRVKFINKFVRTAVNTGTVIIKLGWEEVVDNTRVEVEVPVYPSSTEELMGFLQQQIETQAMSQEEAQVLLQSGQPVQIGVEYKEQIQEQVVVNRPVVQIRDSRDVIIDPTCEGDIDNARFIIDSFTTDLSSLKKDGRYSNLDCIPSSEFNSIVDNGYMNDESKDSSFSFKDKPRQKLRVYEYWGYWDIDDSGIVKPIVASFVGNVMIRLEENPYPDNKLPFVIVQFLPSNDNSIYGEPLAELLKDNQNIIGAVQRGMIDLFGNSANGQQGIAKGWLDPINMQKFKNGDNFEFNPLGDLRASYYMTSYPEVSSSTFNLINFQNAEAEALSGIKAFSQGISGNSLGASVGGIKSALDATAKRELGILRRFSDGLINIGNKIIKMNSVWLSDEEIIRITDNEFVTIKRDDLAGNFDLSVTISTAEEDTQKASELAFLLQTMGNTAPFEVTKMLLSKVATLHKMPKLAKMLDEYEPQPDPLLQEEQQLKVELLKAQIANEQAKAMENQVDVKLKQAKTESELAKAGKLGSEKDYNDLNYIERATGLQQERDLEKVLLSKNNNSSNKQ
jgi:hypothetical protein